MDAAVNYEWKLIDTQFIFDVGVQSCDARLTFPIAGQYYDRHLLPSSDVEKWDVTADRKCEKENEWRYE